MKKISFGDVLPHLLAVIIFLVVTLIFFNPVFFKNRVINQNDINEFLWGSRELREYREATGEEGRWAATMFSGMPAYLVNMDWSDGVVVGMKKVLTLFLPHPVSNIYLAFLSYYIMLLAFRVRPYAAIAFSLAFGLSSYMIIGLSAGHNARIGAIALMPLVLAGIHLSFSGKRLLGFSVTAAALAMQLRENHVQITYYLVIMVLGYGAYRLVEAFRSRQLPEFFKTIGILAAAAGLAACTFMGPLWAITEYSKYSTRGKSELETTSHNTVGSGLPKSYAFQYSNGITEPITMLIPEFYGGSSFHSFVTDQNSATYKALVNSGNEQMANRLAGMARSYWGDQPLSAPYYAGAIVVFFAVLGLIIADRRIVWWLAGVSILAIMMSWGSNFPAFNYFIFDHLPGYNKFRSVTFVMVIVFTALPLLGALALEHLLSNDMNKIIKKKIVIAFAATGGLCLFFVLFAGMLGYTRTEEANLPVWFLNALRDDRRAMLRDDALRSFAFIFSIFVLLYFNVFKKVSLLTFASFLILMVSLDVARVDTRYFTKDNYGRKSDQTPQPWASNLAVMKDKSYYRVLFLQNFYDATMSNFHYSLGGYNGARIKRYQELYDSAISRETDMVISHLQKGETNFEAHGVLDMLNTKYLIFGEDENSYLPNPSANGPAWFVSQVQSVKSPNEELEEVTRIDTRKVALIDESKFTLPNVGEDTTAVIRFVDHKPYWLKYESHSSQNGLAVFSEIYYPEGWRATIDGKPADILRCNYVLRALEIPSGQHTIEFTFEPKPYLIGDKVTMASSWILLLVVLGGLGLSLSFREQPGA